MKVERTKKSIRRIGAVLGPPRTAPDFERKTRVVDFNWSDDQIDSASNPQIDVQTVSPDPPTPESASSSCIDNAGPNAPAPGTYERWSLADESGLTRCKRCGGPIIWAQVVKDNADPNNRRWIPLDPDYMPHGCGGPNAGRTFTIEPESKEIADAVTA